MSAAPNDFQTVRVSTDAVPERERIALMREFYGPKIARLDMEPMSDRPLRFDIIARASPELAIAQVDGTSIRSRRTRKLIADGDDRVCLCISPKAGHQVTHLNRALVSQADTGLLFSHCDTFECITMDGMSRVFNVTVPRKVLAEMVPGLEDRFMRPIPQDSDALSLLTHYIELLLTQDQALATPQLRRLAVAHVHDLTALSLGASRDAAEIANGRGLRAGRLYAIKADILRSLGDPALSLTALAARHRITPRYVQSLFEQEGSTFSQFVLSERLDRVHRLLSDSSQGGRSVSAIAYEAGFGDLSHFNRAFRRRYGATPSDIRAAASPHLLSS